MRNDRDLGLEKSLGLLIRERGIANVLSKDGLEHLLDCGYLTPRPDHARPDPAPFIVIEGADGAGKTTLAKALGELLDSVSIPNFIWSPSSPMTVYGKIAYELARSGEDPALCAQFFAKDRYHSARRIHELRTGETIEGAKIAAPKHIVIADRYALSTAVYQHADGLSAGEALSEVLTTHTSVPEPTATFLIQMEPEKMHERILARGSQADPSESLTLIRRHARDYAHICERMEESSMWRDVLRPIVGELVELPASVADGSVEERLAFIFTFMYLRNMVTRDDSCISFKEYTDIVNSVVMR